MSELRITELFYSLQGETRTVGLPTVFIRLTGCPLRCGYCDSEYAFSGGQRQTIESILEQVASYHPKYVTVSGGEPLAQKACPELCAALCDAGYQVSIETSGAMDISVLDPRVDIVMDLKTPGSNESEKNRWENLDFIKKTDQIKFVICSREDYDWTKQIISEHRLDRCCEVLLSPSYEQLQARTLADWVVEDNLPVRFQLQIHKLIWGDVPGK